MSHKAAVLAQEDEEQDDQIVTPTDVASGAVEDVTRGCFGSIVLLFILTGIIALLFIW